MKVFENPDATFELQANRLFAFYDFVGEIRDKLDYVAPDTRHVNLNNIMMAANASVATLRLMHWVNLNGEAIFIEALKISKPEYINLVVEDMLRSSRLFLLVESQFQIEALLKNILHEMKIPVKKDGFYNVAELILKETSINDGEKKLKILNIAALMRNSMHANGIHYGYKKTDTIEFIDGIEFEFINEKRVQCGSWFHIVTALTASMKIVEEILVSPKVSSMKLVPDMYAKELANM